jgi:SAM-dependent methyltransferase
VSTFEDRWRERFERYARRHADEHSISGWSAHGLRRRVGVFQDLLDQGLLAAGGRVLELGCGAGTYVRLLVKRGHPTVGLDYSVPSLGRAVDADPGRLGRYVAGDAYALPFASGSFDGVVCIGVLQALASPEGALGEITRVLAPKGRLVVETLNPWSPPAVGRRARSRLRGEPSHLHYGAPRPIERRLAQAGARRLRRLALLLPPRSLTGLGSALASPWLGRLVEAVPGLRLVVPHAFWIIGEKHA